MIFVSSRKKNRAKHNTIMIYGRFFKGFEISTIVMIYYQFIVLFNLLSTIDLVKIFLDFPALKI